MQLAPTLNIRTKYQVTSLIAALEKNLELHKEDYKVAVEVYSKTIDDKLEEIIKLCKKSKGSGSKSDVVNLALSLNNLAKPVDATELYEQYIVLLKNSSESVIELSASDASSILNDTWTWAQDAKMTNALYSANSVYAFAASSNKR